MDDVIAWVCSGWSNVSSPALKAGAVLDYDRTLRDEAERSRKDPAAWRTLRALADEYRKQEIPLPAALERWEATCVKRAPAPRWRPPADPSPGGRSGSVLWRAYQTCGGEAESAKLNGTELWWLLKRGFVGFV